MAAAVENMEVLGAPLLGASDAAIRAADADQALGIVTTAAGALSLVLYVVFAVALRRRRAFVAVVGAALAFAGVVANALVLAGGEPWLYELMLYLRYAAGPFMAVFLVVAAAATPLRPLALPIAAPLALTPLAMTGGHGVQIAAALAFSAHALWIWLASLWLLCGGAGRTELVRRAAFLMLVVAAGAVGAALLIVPDATGSFFAWTLQPPPLAAFAGGVYVGSAVVYAVGIRRGATRSLVVAAVVLSVSVLTATLIHLEVFDLSRLQAWAWLFLFAGFATITTALALRREPVSGGPSLSPAIRAIFTAAAIALGVTGLALWADPIAFDLPPLGGRFAGSWTMMLAVLAAWPAVVGRREEAAQPALALIALPAGALVAAARTGTGDPLYLLGLGALVVTGLVLRISTRGGRVDIPDVARPARLETRRHVQPDPSSLRHVW